MFSESPPPPPRPPAHRHHTFDQVTNGASPCHVHIDCFLLIMVKINI